jgi:acyl-CoA thioester hydrolase
MQVVHHSTYPIWFEIGRTALLAEAGFPYHTLEREGTLFPVVEFSCRIHGPADFGDEVDIRTGVASVRSRSIVFSYEVTKRGGVIARGETRHVPVDREKKPKRIPDDLFQALRRWAPLNSLSNGLQNR